MASEENLSSALFLKENVIRPPVITISSTVSSPEQLNNDKLSSEIENNDAFSVNSESSEDEDETNNSQTIADMGRHHRMQRIQKVLYDQLISNDTRLSLELREKEEELRHLQQNRENVGISLYGVQQQLAQLQVSLESSHRKMNTIHDQRFAAEDSLDEWKETLAQMKLTLEKNKAYRVKSQAELDSLNQTLRQVEAYNEEMKSEIAQKQRAAHKTEDSMSQMEKEKVKQDLYIDSLNTQMKKLHEAITVAQAQLKSQALETAAAQETLTEAANQMEDIAFEKKQLMQQWKSSLVGMQQREEALVATKSVMTKVQEEDVAVAAEIRGYKQSIRKAQLDHESLTGTIDRFNSEIRFVEEQISTLMQEHDRLSERYDILGKSLKQTEGEISKLSLKSKQLDQETLGVQQHLETTQRERHALEDAISTQKNTKTTVHKAANNLTKEAAKLQVQLHEREITCANLKNEMARVSVDMLNVSAHTIQLEQTYAKILSELKAEDMQIEKLELEIRQRNDEIEKKMLRLDRLNKKYEQLMSKVEDENTGPLEATIKNLSKETAKIRSDNVAAQKEWLTTQTNLVNVAAESAEISEANNLMKSKSSVLSQKQLRLSNELEQLRKNIKELRTTSDNMHTDTVKLNLLVAKNVKRHEELLNTNHGMEITFQNELKALEADSVAMEGKASALKVEKNEILSEIVEVERQIMLWEKKIQLEKETQAALDPEVGQVEARSMEKEIHRMRLRLETLQRSQEQMILEMEQAIHKRDLIALRGRSKKDTELTYAALNSKVATLQNSIKKVARETENVDAVIKSKLVNVEDVSFHLEKAMAELKVTEERNTTLQMDISNGLYEKQRLIDVEARKIRMLKKFDSLRKKAESNQVTDQADNSEAKTLADLENAKVLVDKVKEMIQTLQTKQPHLSEVLSRVILLAEDPKPT